MPTRTGVGCVVDHPLPANVQLHQTRFCSCYDGRRIVESGGPELAFHLEEQGYDWVREKYGK